MKVIGSSSRSQEQKNLKCYPANPTLKHGCPQAWAKGRGGTCPHPWKCCKVFCALVFTVKRSVDQLFMHYFHNFCRLRPQTPTEARPGLRWGTFVSRSHNLPIPGKNPAGAHELKWEHDYNCRFSERVASVRGGEQTWRRKIPCVISVPNNTLLVKGCV